MGPSQPVDNLTASREALNAGAWADAQQAFERVLAIEEIPEALEGLGLAAWWLNRSEIVFDARERAFRAYRHRGDQNAAARVAVWRQCVSWSVANPSVMSASERSSMRMRSATRPWFAADSRPMTAHCSAVDSSMRVKLVGAVVGEVIGAGVVVG